MDLHCSNIRFWNDYLCNRKENPVRESRLGMKTTLIQYFENEMFTSFVRKIPPPLSVITVFLVELTTTTTVGRLNLIYDRLFRLVVW